jgi:hypothetical protein
MNGGKNAAESSFLCLWTAGDSCLPPRLMRLMNTHYQHELRRCPFVGLQKVFFLSYFPFLRKRSRFMTSWYPCVCVSLSIIEPFYRFSQKFM